MYQIPLTLCRGLPMTLHSNTQSAAQTRRVIHFFGSHIWPLIDRLRFRRLFLFFFFYGHEFWLQLGATFSAPWLMLACFILFYRLHLFLLFITGLIAGNKVCGTLSRMRNSHVLIFSLPPFLFGQLSKWNEMRNFSFIYKMRFTKWLNRN